MHLLAIGDIHGRDSWKEISGTKADHIVFVGDFVDARRDIEGPAIIRNFQDILYFKKTEPDRVTLLLGNHDIQYFYYPDYRCSGFQADLQPTYTELFTRNANLFQIAFQYQQYLFTHAGVSTKWYGYHQHLIEKYLAENRLGDALNAIHRSEERKILFEAGGGRGGMHPYGGPVWADKSETEADYLIGYHQVVGHSRVPQFIRNGDERSSITYIDVLTRRTEFYEIELP
ncbi:metallophosphoesterase [Telluribacter sp.]|jgi:predicted MPP superfamily phosphohydrolase|uniref:metallophosphoesterase n=1 Tax=Telluribacter sp. TaxID=1978767 RepID=UPI002E11ED66|nr:metallophosphoesterase [Telluribacter sp.]